MNGEIEKYNPSIIVTFKEETTDRTEMAIIGGKEENLHMRLGIEKLNWEC